MANQYDTNLKLQAIADAIGDSQSSGLIQALEDIADAVAGGGGGGSSTAGLVSDNFSETDTYDLGDYCIHNNTLYVCINAITTPGAWDLSDWQATNAGMELSSLNSALVDKPVTITPASNITIILSSVYKVGNICYFSITFSSSVAGASYDVCTFDVTSKYRQDYSARDAQTVGSGRCYGSCIVANSNKIITNNLAQNQMAANTQYQITGFFYIK